MVAILVVQWANLLISRTRIMGVSIIGMDNIPCIIAGVVETLIIVCLCYIPFLNSALGTRMIAFPHFALPAFSFFMIIIIYEETRKVFVRRGMIISQETGRIKCEGWFSRNTLY